MSKRVLITAGGTGGHFFPALALYEYLLAQGEDVIFITDSRCAAYIPSHFQGKIKIIDVKRFAKCPITLTKFTFSLIISYLRNLFLIILKRRKTVYSFGGYTSVATLLAAITCFRRIILVEENIIVGRTNILFSKFAKHIAFGFDDVSFVPQQLQKKIVVTGIPVRELNIIKRKDNKFRIFVIGGSQGAHIFSKIIPELMASLAPDLQQKIKLQQQVREEDIEQVKAIYNEQKYDYEIAPFFARADEMIANCDLVISRSGASTIAEIIAANKYAILIPYKAAKDNHQFHNAQYLVERGEASLFSEDGIDIKQMKEVIENRIVTKDVKDSDSTSSQAKRKLYDLA